jgi:hypothetical protein
MPTSLLRWSPRILGVFVSLFLGAFALDAFSGGKPFAEALTDFLIHLIPSLVVLALVAGSWYRPWLGGLGFVGLGIAYVTVAGNRVDWIIAISGPLLVVGILFLWSWWHERRPTTPL